MHISDNRWLGIAMRIAVVLIIVLIAFRALQSQADSPAISKLCCFAIIPAACVFEYVQYNKHSKKHKHGAMVKSYEHHADFDASSVGSMQSAVTTRSEMLGHLSGLHPRAHDNQSDKGSAISANTTITAVADYVNILNEPFNMPQPARSIASSVKPQEHRQSASDGASTITTMSHMMQFLAQAQPPTEAPPADKLQDLISKLSLQPQVYDNLDSVSVSGVIADAPSIGIAPSSVVVQEVGESRSIDNTVSPAIDTSIENVVKLLQDRFDSMSGVV